jgi:membrane fusion protein (multidrug efflux system)
MLMDSTANLDSLPCIVMLKTTLGSILLLAAVIGIGFFIGRQKYLMMTAPPVVPSEQPVMVVFKKVEPTILRQSATAVGTVLAPRSLQLRNEVVGTISEIKFQPGDEVVEDQVLLKLDTSVEAAQLLSAQAALDMSKSALDRTKKAASTKAISELEFDQVLAQSLQADAEVKRLEALIRKKTLKAPFNARAGLFDLHLGQYLPEGTQITMLQGLDDYVHVDFMMPQQVADEVSVGDEVRIQLETESLPAKIVAVDTQADRITRNVLARAKLKNPPSRLQPNDSVRVSIEYGTTRPAVTIPAAALRRSPSEAFVYVVQSDAKEPEKKRAFKRVVTVGGTVGQSVAILQGLEPDTEVVSDGSFKIRDEAWVVQAENRTAPQESEASPLASSKQGDTPGP